MSNLHVIVGLGITGFSCAQYLSKQNIPIAITDSRPNPPHLEAFKKKYPTVPISLGQLDNHLLEKAACIVLSPGISLHDPIIAAAIDRGTPVIGDIELFARAVHVPVIAITGTNAKSTVTTLVGKMAAKAGFNVQVGGNLGVPALDLLMAPAETNLFVLELSSFQLETTFSLQPQVATVLNVTPDHMDRYRSLQEYQQAKQRVYRHCKVAVCNREDPLTTCELPVEQTFYFSLQKPEEKEFGLVSQSAETYLAFGKKLLMPVNELPIKGKHYQANALAALAIGHGMGMSFSAMLEVLREFKGLPHRCQWVRERNQITWYNDSKGTNVGATLAAIEGLGSEIPGKLILIAGGLGKNADFHPLVSTMQKYARHVVLIGEAAEELARVIDHRIPVSFANTMEEAVQLADQAAIPKDSVLLSPACASYDMFKNFEHRGDVFTRIVESL